MAAMWQARGKRRDRDATERDITTDAYVALVPHPWPALGPRERKGSEGLESHVLQRIVRPINSGLLRTDEEAHTTTHQSSCS